MILLDKRPLKIFFQNVLKIKEWKVFFLILCACCINTSFLFSQSNENKATIELSVLPGLQFDKVRFHVKPKQKVKISFTNTDDMDHNLLILLPGSRERVVAKANRLGSDGHNKNYNPATEDVLWALPILQGKESKILEFVAPDKEGIYPYVCTVPGHGTIMYGAMYVSNQASMPDIKIDGNIPESRRTVEKTATVAHPFSLKPPYYYRTYIEGVSPAAIVVHLPHRLSYCWDASSCKLVLVWEGDFVDNTDIWKGHKDARSKILGNVFYNEKVQVPIEIIGNNVKNKVAFKGYKIVKGGYLELHYTLDDVDIYETIKDVEHGQALLREFRILGLEQNVYFNYTATPKVEYFYKGKKLVGNKIEMKAEDAQSFSVLLKLEK